MVEGARLESVYTSNRIKGSNPFLSAIKNIGFMGTVKKVYNHYYSKILAKVYTR